MSRPTFFGRRFWGARYFGRPYWGPRETGGGGSGSGVDEILLSAAQAARILRDRIRRALGSERERLVLLLALVEGDDDL